MFKIGFHGPQSNAKPRVGKTELGEIERIAASCRNILHMKPYHRPKQPDRGSTRSVKTPEALEKQQFLNFAKPPPETPGVGKFYTCQFAPYHPESPGKPP